MKERLYQVLLNELFEHIGRPSEGWPQLTIGKNVNGRTMWSKESVDDEFRDYLMRIENSLASSQD
jgi:hypothetical protein